MEAFLHIEVLFWVGNIKIISNLYAESYKIVQKDEQTNLGFFLC